MGLNIDNITIENVLSATTLTVYNPINGSITGNSATVTTNANLSGAIISIGNTTSHSYNSVNAVGNITTASATAVLATNMTITPGVGTYIVWFNTDLTHSTNSRIITISIYANGSLVTNSDRTTYFNNGSNDRIVATTMAIVTVSAGQTIEGRWLTPNPTATMGNRILTLLKLS